MARGVWKYLFQAYKILRPNQSEKKWVSEAGKMGV